MKYSILIEPFYYFLWCWLFNDLAWRQRYLFPYSLDRIHQETIIHLAPSATGYSVNQWMPYSQGNIIFLQSLHPTVNIKKIIFLQFSSDKLMIFLISKAWLIYINSMYRSDSIKYTIRATYTAKNCIGGLHLRNQNFII